MDDNLLRDMIENNRDGSGKFTRRMAINIARFFDMQPMDMVKELENRKLIKTGSYLWFEHNGGITKKHIEQAKQGKLI
jgi:stalled ribosome alternative rescue factor ArfA